ncbi:calcium-binding protein [Rhodobacter sp. NSM]|uniref:calcium-binding protein n=1 Tax=Rhodobacter sp. NSM TaxID=3457501 RepID=UPI003FD2FF29
MTTFYWSGSYAHRTFRDLGSPYDPTEVTSYDVYGIYSTSIWSGSSRDRIVGTAGTDLIFMDSLGHSTPRITGIATIHAGAGDDLVDFTSQRFTYGPVRFDGGTGNDWLLGNDGADTISGGSGNDWLKGYAGSDRLIGGSGADSILGGRGTDVLLGGSGNDQLAGEEGHDRLFGGLGRDFLSGGADRDALWGGDGADRILGGAGHDTLVGGAGNDILAGGSGNDRLLGGLGTDLLRGGAGADLFVFHNVRDSAPAGRDRILDFGPADRIDLRGIDADATRDGDQAFLFIGSRSFSGRAGELRHDLVRGNTFIGADIDGDGRADFSLRIDGAVGMGATDFLL